MSAPLEVSAEDREVIAAALRSYRRRLLHDAIEARELGYGSTWAEREAQRAYDALGRVEP